MVTDVASRKKSPRAPSLSLEDAIERVAKIYKHEGRNAAPTEVVAKHLGYNGAKNGAALSMLASLGYFGLMERPAEGQLAVSRDFESYQYAPDESVRKTILNGWLRTPPVFAQLLDKYTERLPSDGVLRYDLIQSGFSPSSAEACVNVFRRSVESAGFYDISVRPSLPTSDLEVDELTEDFQTESSTASSPLPDANKLLAQTRAFEQLPSENFDRIPVRLSQNRRAYIEVPNPLYEADKKRLISQIELLLTDDDL